MVMRVRQRSRVRPGGRVRIRSNMPNRKITLSTPRIARTNLRIRQG